MQEQGLPTVIRRRQGRMQVAMHRIPFCADGLYPRAAQRRGSGMAALRPVGQPQASPTVPR